jgi:tricorn protease
VKHIIGIVLFLGLATANVNASDADTILYPRYPALSPDGSTLAFCYQGDIWTVNSNGGDATRFTIHKADDIRPSFSPDGEMILFSSRRFNNYDVFVIPASGGPARQLTVHSAEDIASSWFPDGDSVLFVSNRDSWRDIFKVSIQGGTPIRVTGYRYEQEYGGRITPDRKYMIYNNGSGASRWWRKDLKTSRNADIWLLDRSSKDFSSRRLTTYENHDVWPVLNTVTNDVYFVSCRDDYGQIFRIPLSGGEPEQLTHFTDDGVQWMNSNPQGTILVFEQGLGIWILDPEKGTPGRVSIRISSDERENLSEKKALDDVEWFALSPDEKKIAAIVHGEVYVTSAGESETALRITETESRERFVTWGSDSRSVYYASDRNGNYDIYSANAVSGTETQITSGPKDETKPEVSRDGKLIAFYRGLDEIILLELETNTEKTVLHGSYTDLGIEPTREYTWSPDSRWLVFTNGGPTFETDIYISDLNGNARNVSKFAGWNFRPRFSNDGKLVYFTSTATEEFTTYKIELVHGPAEFDEASLDSLFLDNENQDHEKDGNEDDSVIVDIDFSKIESRRARAYDLSTSSFFPVLTPDAEKYVFVSSLMGKPEIWTIDAEKNDELKQLTHTGKDKSSLTVTSDGKYVFYLEGDKIKKTAIDGGDTETIPVKADIEIDQKALTRQKFLEAWSMLNTYFYDPNFHGADWAAARDKYLPAVDHIRTARDFRDIVHEMLGELKASHMSVYPRRPSPSSLIETAYLGAEFDLSEFERTGNLRFSRVFSESPVAVAGINAGDYIVDIDGIKVDRSKNVFEYLAGKKGRRLTVKVAESPRGKTRDIELKPISASDHNELLYNDWVDTRRHLVDSLSGGKLAYLHIEGMNRKRLEQFKQELVSVAEDKEGLIIDVRNNGGGNIAVHLLGILARSPYVLRNFRGFPVTSENKMRSKAAEKPMVLLINNYSASNSEIFAEGFRKLGLGKIIGEPTAGAVIGTSSYRLIDGTRIRRPSWGAYTTDMEDTELRPRQPDIFVEDLPDDFMNDRDPQLVRAVDELLKEL